MARDLILGLDTCTRWLNLALLDGDGTLIASTQEEVTTHTTRVIAGLEGLLRSAGRPKGDTVALGVILGPGSFTGLRVGLAATEGLSRGLGIPSYGLDSLTALAEASHGNGFGMALLDARRKQVYARAFRREDGAVIPAGELVAVAPELLSTAMPQPEWAIGDGVPLVSAWPDGCLLEPGIPNLAVPAAREARRRMLERAPATPLTPQYVRPPDVREPGK